MIAKPIEQGANNVWGERANFVSGESGIGSFVSLKTDSNFNLDEESSFVDSESIRG